MTDATFIEGDKDFVHGFWREPAPRPAVVECLNGDRSDWYWIRLPNGDLIIGFYPMEGDKGTYTSTEHYRTI